MANIDLNIGSVTLQASADPISGEHLMCVFRKA